MKISTIKYVGNVLDPINKGWANCVIQNNEKIALPYTTKVKHVDAFERFELVKVLEGYYKENIVELPYMSKNRYSRYSFLVENFRSSKPISIYLNNNILEFGNFKCEVLSEKDTLNEEIYFIKFPIKTNKVLSGQYFDERKGGSRYADTWFPLQAKGELYPEKYLHFGSISQGCVTVKYNPLARSVWNIIYMKLIHSRIDENNLGYLVIKD